MKKLLLLLLVFLPLGLAFLSSTTHAYADTRLEPLSYEPIPCGSSCTTLRIYYNQAPPAGGWGLVNYTPCCASWSGSAGPTNIHDTYADYTWDYPYNQGAHVNVLQNGDTVSSPFTIDFSITQPTTFPTFNSVEVTGYEFIPCGSTCGTVRIYYNQAPPAGGWGLINWYNHMTWSGAAGPTNIHDTYADYTFYNPYVPTGLRQYVIISGYDFSSPYTIDWSTFPVNTAPSVQSLPNATINEGTYSASGSFTDTDSTSWTATVDYGDSSGTQPLTLSGMNFSLSHQYKDEGTYTVTVKVTDNQGATGTGTATVTVNNVAPTPGTVTVAPNPVQINTSVTASATFTDPDVLDTHTATIDWGDQTGTHPCMVTESNGSGSVSCSLLTGYASANVYPVVIYVSDGTASGTSPIAYASVYDPTNSSVFSAGQLFSSPAGAYTANASLTGTVLFGLSYKYQGIMPSGLRTFSMDFNQANLHFNATSVNAFVVSSGFATLTGSGTINGGTSTYNFLVTGVSGGGIRIQITDPANNNAVIYDTQPGDPVTATPTTSVKGQVIAHN